MLPYIFHSVNEGLFLFQGGTSLIIDGVHRGTEVGFSNFPSALTEQMQSHTGIFARPSGFLFTHRHPDHFDIEGLYVARRVHPTPDVYCPTLPESTIYPDWISDGVYKAEIGNAEVYILPTDHDGACFKKVVHVSYLIKMEQTVILLPGDAILKPEFAQRCIKANIGHVDAAFLNFFQASEPDSLECLRLINPRRVFLYHLPFQEDDVYSFRRQTIQAARRFPPELAEPEMIESMRWIDDRVLPIPNW